MIVHEDLPYTIRTAEKGKGFEVYLEQGVAATRIATCGFLPRGGEIAWCIEQIERHKERSK